MTFQAFLEDLKRLLENGDEIEPIRLALKANSRQINQNHPWCSERNCTRFKRSEECNPNNKEILKLIENYPEFLTKKSSIDLRKYFKRAVLKGDTHSIDALLLIGTTTFENSYGDRNTLLKLINLAEPEDLDIVDIARLFPDLNLGDPFSRSSPLKNAIAVKNAPLVRYFLDLGLPVNLDEPSLPALQYFNGDLTILDMLIDQGADVNGVEQPMGETALHLACRFMDQPLIKYFLRKGADANLRDIAGFSPLDFLNARAWNYDWCLRIVAMETARGTFNQDQPNLGFMEGRPEVQRIFEECKAELRVMAGTEFYRPYTFYHVATGSMGVKKLAALVRNETLVEKFLTFSRKLEYYREDLRDAWQEALRIREAAETVERRLWKIFGHMLPDVIVKKLTRHLTLKDLPVSSDKFTYTLNVDKKMTFQAFLEDLKRLLENGDEIVPICLALQANAHQLNQDHPRCDERTCIKYKRPEECNANNREIIKLIDDYPNFLITKTNINLRKYLKRALFKGDTLSVSTLMLIGASIFEPFFHQETSILDKLIRLAEPEDMDIVDIARFFPDLNLGDPFERSSLLTSAIGVQNAPLVRYFLDLGLPVNLEEPSVPALHFSIPKFSGDLTVLDILMDQGADVNRPDYESMTVLNYACLNMDSTLIKYFLRKGADFNHRDMDFMDTSAWNYDWCMRIVAKEVARANRDLKGLPEVQRIFEECKAELRVMAETEFYRSYTFYQVAMGSMGVKKLAALVRNETLVDKFLTFSKKLEYYREDLRDAWQEALRIREATETVERRLWKIFGHMLPDVVVKKLTGNLPLEDLPVS